MKVGILGGTFDPIHNAHIEIAKAALNQFSLDKVMVMPTPNPPHKDKNTITSNFHRINMIKLAILPYENIEFSDFEINMHDVTYTADTLYLLNELNPDIEYYFILGSDSIMSFLSWYRPDIILKYAKLLTVRRDDESFDLMDSKIKEIEDGSISYKIDDQKCKPWTFLQALSEPIVTKRLKKLFRNQYINILSIMICILILTLTEPGPLTK